MAIATVARGVVAKAKTFPRAIPHYGGIAGRVLGNFADIKPWDTKEPLGVKLFAFKDKWYKAVENYDGEGEPESVLVNLAGRKFLFTTDVGLIREITANHSSKMQPFKEMQVAWGKVMPKGLIFTSGALWKRIRPIFSQAMIRMDHDQLPAKAYAVCKQADELVLPKVSGVVNVVDLTSNIIFDAFYRIAFNQELNLLKGENKQIINDALFIGENQADWMLMPASLAWLRYLFVAKWFEFQGAVRRLRSYVTDLVDEKEAAYRKGVEDGTINPLQSKADNLMDALVFACFEQEFINADQAKESKRAKSVLKSVLSKSELRDQLIMAIFAGYETTTSTCGLIMKHLSEHVDVQEKLYEAVKDIDLSSATATELAENTYLNSCINEAQRLGSNFPAIPRLVAEDFEVDGYTIKKGWRLFYDNDRLGKMPSNWQGASAEDLEKFRPERWVNYTPPKGAYNPFGIGPRACIGKRIASIQMQTLLTFIIQNFRIYPTDKPIEPTYIVGRSIPRDSTLKFERRI